jgi:Uma2 family endonuclease
MATAALRPPEKIGPCDWTFAQVQEQLGGIPPDRIRAFPAAGTATEEDLQAALARTDRTCELVDGILVEKAMGSFESLLAGALISLLGPFVDEHDLGVVLAPDGMLKLFPGLIRAPDVSFIRWERFPGDRLPAEPFWPVCPDLAVEILSPGNTEEEMRRKIREYFKAGAGCVWIVDPPSRTAKIYTSPRRFALIGEDGTLEAAGLLPGFQLRLKDWFARAARRKPRRKK